jgi:hypothetical protein
MPQANDADGFSMADYLPAHRLVILLRFKQAPRLHRCSLCGKKPVRDRRALVHVALKSLRAEALDAGQYVRSLALCAEHMALDHDALADYCWPGWREEWVR